MLTIKDIYYLCQQNQAALSESGEAVIIFYSRWGIEGYIRLPSGLLIQWGVISQDSSSAAGYWVDVPFNSRGSNTYYVGYLDYPATVSGFSTRIRHVDSAFWLAIGY